MSESNFIIGEGVILRGLDENDATKSYEQWLNDSTVTEHMETGRFPESMCSIKDFIASMNSGNQNLLLGIYLKDSEEHVGNVKLGPINWIHRNAELGIMIGSSSARGKGVGTETIKLVVKHAFERLNLLRVSLGVVETNQGAIRCYEKVGFIQEGVYRKAVIAEGKALNVVRMGILSEELNG